MEILSYLCKLCSPHTFLLHKRRILCLEPTFLWWIQRLQTTHKIIFNLIKTLKSNIIRKFKCLPSHPPYIVSAAKQVPFSKDHSFKNYSYPQVEEVTGLLLFLKFCIPLGHTGTKYKLYKQLPNWSLEEPAVIPWLPFCDFDCVCSLGIRQESRRLIPCGGNELFYFIQWIEEKLENSVELATEPSNIWISHLALGHSNQLSLLWIGYEGWNFLSAWNRNMINSQKRSMLLRLENRTLMVKGADELQARMVPSWGLRGL